MFHLKALDKNLMAIITHKARKVAEIIAEMSNPADFEEFMQRFIERYPKEWATINRTYEAEERADKKGRGHPMPHPVQYLKNALKVGLLSTEKHTK